MVFPQYFFALCAVLLFAAVGGTHAEEQSESIQLSNADFEILSNYIAKNGGNVGGRNSMATAVRIIEQAFRGAKQQCITEAALRCKLYWNNSGALVHCAGNYLMANKVRCYIVG